MPARLARAEAASPRVGLAFICGLGPAGNPAEAGRFRRLLRSQAGPEAERRGAPWSWIAWRASGVGVALNCGLRPCVGPPAILTPWRGRQALRLPLRRVGLAFIARAKRCRNGQTARPGRRPWADWRGVERHGRGSRGGCRRRGRGIKCGLALCVGPPRSPTSWREVPSGGLAQRTAAGRRPLKIVPVVSLFVSFLSLRDPSRPAAGTISLGCFHLLTRPCPRPSQGLRPRRRNSCVAYPFRWNSNVKVSLFASFLPEAGQTGTRSSWRTLAELTRVRSLRASDAEREAVLGPPPFRPPFRAACAR
ncbi:hypothetical protein SADUNF_Sadunf07G0063600 [Salix dunnii]|uniref:Uncharacterized protein n=1 Tax=Salix dunnii TaxID=1413687 RepID=A0A835MVU3_9ROSI|nr:hypothetical protein SADUNF_Sadunf07G0063600 [Salix dunnii]